MSKNNLPNEKGFYWAKTDSFKWFNAIVHVVGDSPFYTIEGWCTYSETCFTKLSKIEEWRPKIEEPCE